jgi:hypothetical protein
MFELDKRQDGAELQEAVVRMTGHDTVPAIFIEGKFMGGADDMQSLLPGGVLKKRVQLAHANLHIKHRFDTPLAGPPHTSTAPTVHHSSVSTSSFDMGLFGDAGNYFGMSGGGGSSSSGSLHSRFSKSYTPARKAPTAPHPSQAAQQSRSPTAGGAKRGGR